MLAETDSAHTGVRPLRLGARRIIVRLLVSATLAISILANGLAGFALAETVEQSGLDGAPGEPGDVGVVGGPGSDGSDASAAADLPGEATNFALAAAGDGGEGGAGGAGEAGFAAAGVGGPGGDGGDASSLSVVARGDVRTRAQASAFAGAGGVGGRGGLAPALGRALPGPGGHGGSARSEVRLPSGLASLQTADAEAVGGDGGSGLLGGGGGDGRAHAEATIGDSSISHAISAASGGGDGGDSIRSRRDVGRIGGVGGSATSSLVLSGELTRGRFTSSARAGRGGSSDFGTGGRGGDAAARATIDADLRDRVEIVATGGTGGTGAGVGHRGGDGGGATVTVSGRSAAGMTATGGSGGGGVAGAGGGDGASVELSGRHPMSTDSPLTLIQSAIGGGGGSVEEDFAPPAIGGSGGDATALLDLRASSDRLLLGNSAEGGRAGSSTASSGSNRAGDALAETRGANPDGEVAVAAEAVGGRGGAGAGSTGGATDGGRATAIAVGRGGADVRNGASAEAIGGRAGRARSGPSRTGGNADATSILLSGSGSGSGSGAGVGTSRSVATARGGGGDTAGDAMGSGGDGGDASARAEAHGFGPGGSVLAGAWALGGFGGSAEGAGTIAGDGGDATASGRVTQATATSAASVEVEAIGGPGGDHRSGHGRGGAGGDATVIDGATGDTTGDTAGDLEIEYSARGGDGGSRGSLEYDGAGGDATAVLTLVNPSGGNVVLDIEAAAGLSRNAGRSGATSMAVDVTTGGTIDITAEAMPAGDADLELGRIVGRSIGGGQVRTQLHVAPAPRAESGGRSISVVDRVSAETSGRHVLSQTVDGGDNGNGSGGDAESRLTHDAGTSELVAEVEAAGGSGGNDASGVSRADGGRAVAGNFARQAAADGSATVSAAALGGRAGAAGRGGDALAEVGLETATSRAGEATAFARAGMGSSAEAGGRAEAHAVVTGDGAGRYESIAVAAGGLGSVGGESTATARGVAHAGELVVRASAAHGNSMGQDASGNGRSGLDAEATNLVSGEARILHLEQVVAAGEGAHASVEGANGGDGGDARSRLSIAGGAAEELTVITRAFGARAGLGQGIGARGGAGGHSRSEVVVEQALGSVAVEAHATAGSGGFVAWQDEDFGESPPPPNRGSDGGDGGDVFFGRVFGESVSGGAVSVAAYGRAGDGGDLAGYSQTGGVGGDGASLMLDDLVEGRTSGSLSLIQEAIAGDGGRGEGGGGLGGNARSALTRSFSQESVSLRLFAESGSGGVTRDGLAASGGDALATANVTQQGGDLMAIASARARGSIDRSGHARVEIDALLEGDGHRLQVGAEDSRAEGGANAQSRSSGIATGDSEVFVFDGAVGGEGEFVSREGATGGLGGVGTSHAEGRNAGAAPVFVRSSATGGTGGRSLRGAAGDGGVALATALGISTGGGDVQVEAVQQGGDGRVSGTSSSRGADSSAFDIVRGETSGLLTLHQHAVGGGSFSGLAEAGAARSVLQASNPGGGALHAIAEATGGFGGGSAAADVNAVDEVGRPLSVRAIATGGDYRQAGAEAGASVRAAGISRAGGSVDVLARATGGAGDGRSVPGADVTLVDAVRGKTRGVLTLRQEAIGGSESSDSAATSRGSHATSLVTATNPSGGDLHLSSLARAGRLGPRSVPVRAGAGGSALGSSVGHGHGDAFVSVSDEAVGGQGRSGGQARSSATGRSFGARGTEVTAHAVGGDAAWFEGRSGDARASASGAAHGGSARVRAIAEAGAHATASRFDPIGFAAFNRSARVHADALATGQSSLAESLAIGRSGRLGDREIEVEASATAAGQGSLSTEARVGHDASSAFSSSRLAAAAAEGVHDRAGEWTRAALVLRSGKGAIDITLGSEIRVRTAPDFAVGESIFVSFLDFEQLGDLFHDLRFEVRNGEDLVAEQTLTTAEQIAAFFGSVLSIGSFVPKEEGSGLDLLFRLEGRAKARGASVGTYFAVGTAVVPEPGAAVLIVLGLIVLSRVRPDERLTRCRP